MNNLINAPALSFRGIVLTPVARDDGKIWLTSADLANALGYKESDSVSRIYDRNADEFSSDMSLTVMLTVCNKNNELQENKVRIFSLRGAHLVAMLARTEIAKDFRKWILDLLERENRGQVLPTLPATYLEALRELVKSEEEKQRIAHERDEALRTKAWISSSREASTLAKYGQAKRKIERLEDRLGESRNWRQVKAIRWLGHYFDLRLPGAYSQIGRALADISAELDLPPRKVPHGEFNEVNAYHRGAIEAFRQRLDEGEKILAKYRRHEADFWL